MFAVSVDKLYFRSIGSRDDLMDGEYFVTEISADLLDEIMKNSSQVVSDV